MGLYLINTLAPPKLPLEVIIPSDTTIAAIMEAPVIAYYDETGIARTLLRCQKASHHHMLSNEMILSDQVHVSTYTQTGALEWELNTKTLECDMIMKKCSTHTPLTFSVPTVCVLQSEGGSFDFVTHIAHFHNGVHGIHNNIMPPVTP